MAAQAVGTGRRMAGEVVHGTPSGYGLRHCRCTECRAAMIEARRRVRERRRQSAASGDREVAHGTWAAYTTDKCRCEVCREFKAAYMRRWRARRKATTGPEDEPTTGPTTGPTTEEDTP